MVLPSQLLVSEPGQDRPVFRRGGRIVMWSRFRHDVACMLAGVQGSGAHTVVIHAEDNYEFAVTLFACLHAGVHMVIPGNMRGSLADWGDAPGLVVSSELQVPDVPACINAVESSRVIVEFHTSGSTGEPKRIARSFANLEAELVMLEELFPEDSIPTEVFPTVSFHHAYGIIFGLLLPLSRGIVSDATPFHGLDAWLARVEDSTSLTWLVVTPALLRAWSEYGVYHPLNGKTVRILSAGSPLPAAVAKRVADSTGAEVYEIFGSSETGVAAYRRPLQTDEWKMFAPVSIELAGEVGMLVSSPAVPAGTKACLGDSAELLPGGRFRLLPRVDRIVKLADKRLSLVEVERCLEESELVVQSYALVLELQSVSRLAVALVPSEQGLRLLQEEGYAAFISEMRQRLLSRIEKTLLPRKWRIVGELPMNAQGKVTRQAVAEMFSCPLQLPIATPISKSPDQLRFRALYVPDSAYFAGHFPTYPIVPGVVILQGVASLLMNYWGLQVDGIVRLKFSAETLPAHLQEIVLTRKNDFVSVEITLQHSGDKACQGRFRVSPSGREASHLL